jgi:hypothetical protein
MTEEEAREALANWATQHKQRDTLVREAVAAGVTKHQVHQITGLARTTIDFILKGGTVEKYDDSEMRAAIVQGVAQYILRGEAHTKNPAHSDAQILARVRHDVTDVLQYGYTFPEDEAEKIAADAKETARWQQDHNVNWDQWAFGH